MKKILLTLVVFASFGLVAKLNAQSCTVSQPTITLNSSTTSGGNCVFDVDITFDLAANGGNKFQNVHIWTNSVYNTPLVQNIFGNSTNSVPSVSDLNAAPTLATLTIDKDLTTTVCYNRNGSGCSGTQPTTNQLGLTVIRTVTGGTTTITIKHVQLTIAGGCTLPNNLRSDVWSTQSSSNGSISCVNRGFSFLVNDPVLSGFKDCNNPRMLHFGVYTSGSVPAKYTYRIYKDDGNGSFDAGDSPVTLTASLTDTITVTSAGAGGQVGRVVGFTGNDAPGEHFNYWVVVTPVGGTFNAAILLQNGACSPLPIGLKSFTASRNHANVNVAWVTSFESNSNGFEVQRQMGGSSWQTITFVPTKAVNGSSTRDLSYSYVDLNNTRGISNYRIALIDLDGKTKYSDIRSVRGEGQIGKIIVYPNPSLDGAVKVVFDDASTQRDVSLMDATGRVIKQWKDVSNNNLQIDNLTPGFYSLRVVVKETGEQSVEKIVVNKR